MNKAGIWEYSRERNKQIKKGTREGLYLVHCIYMSNRQRERVEWGWIDSYPPMTYNTLYPESVVSRIYGDGFLLSSAIRRSKSWGEGSSLANRRWERMIQR